MNTKRIQLLGTGLWDDPRIYATPALDGGVYAAPDAGGYRSSPTATGKRFNKVRYAPRRSPMTRSRWSPRW